MICLLVHTLMMCRRPCVDLATLLSVSRDSQYQGTAVFSSNAAPAYQQRLGDSTGRFVRRPKHEGHQQQCGQPQGCCMCYFSCFATSVSQALKSQPLNSIALLTTNYCRRPFASNYARIILQRFARWPSKAMTVLFFRAIIVP